MAQDTLLPLTSYTHLPCKICEFAKVPDRPIYKPCNDFSSSGFSFRIATLLHAIALKSASPSTRLRRNDLIQRALGVADCLDYSGSILRIRDLPPQDFRSQLSHQFGVGVTCLTACLGWNARWPSLVPIPGKGKRFDFRATLPDGKTAILEAKGTTSAGTQTKQIKSAIVKKNHHRSNETADLELIISTRIGHKENNSCVIFADPPMDFDERAFHPDMELAFDLRHASRILQLSGLDAAARRTLSKSKQIERDLFPDKFKQSSQFLDYAIAAISIYGREQPLLEPPPGTARSVVEGKTYYTSETASISIGGASFGVRFGILADQYTNIAYYGGSQSPFAHQAGAMEPEVIVKDGLAASIMSDGSVMIIESD